MLLYQLYLILYVSRDMLFVDLFGEMEFILQGKGNKLMHMSVMK